MPPIHVQPNIILLKTTHHLAEIILRQKHPHLRRKSRLYLSQHRVYGGCRVANRRQWHRCAVIGPPMPERGHTKAMRFNITRRRDLSSNDQDAAVVAKEGDRPFKRRSYDVKAFGFGTERDGLTIIIANCAQVVPEPSLADYNGGI